jgi:phosphate starvation-inducible protein PhoH and related proteins
MERTIKLISDEEAIALYGALDERLRFAESEFDVRVAASNQKLTISGAKQNVTKAVDFFELELSEIRENHAHPAKKKNGEATLPLKDVSYDARTMSEVINTHKDHQNKEKFGVDVSVVSKMSLFLKNKIIKPKTRNQDVYLDAVMSNDIVIAIGPAGTGKTYLAMAAAIDALKRKKVSRLVLTRPAVEAGESLGYLPGDLHAKINPYLRPLYDALYDMMEFDDVSRYLRRGVIEVAPLAYMRGRTLNESFVILDEGQNCTHEQMKMFLTRLGQSSQAVVTGDITQIDLPKGKRSGLVEAKRILSRVTGIRFCYFNERDVVRHRLVQDIICAYEKYERK